MSATTIGATHVIDGEISGAGDLVIAGTVRGRVTGARSLQVTTSGVVEADIDTGTARISGRVTGHVVASGPVELLARGWLVGRVTAPVFSIARGATLTGDVDLES